MIFTFRESLFFIQYTSSNFHKKKEASVLQTSPLDPIANSMLLCYLKLYQNAYIKKKDK